MKQKILYIILLFFTLAWSGEVLAWGETTSYVLTEQNASGLEIMTSGSSSRDKTYSWDGPGKKLTFKYKKKSWISVPTGSYYVYGYTDKNASQGQVELKKFGAGSSKTDYQTVTIEDIGENIRSLKFHADGTEAKIIASVMVTRATTLSTTTSSLAFGNIHRITNKTKTLNASVAYNNTTYNQQVTGTNLPGCYSVEAKSVGATGTVSVPVTFTAASNTSLGDHNGTITLSMNGKTVSISATAKVVTTYYGKATAAASTGGNAYVSFSSYDEATTANAETNTANTANSSEKKKAYYKVKTQNGYRFLGWIKGTGDYNASNVVSTSLTYNPDITYSSEDSSAPTVTTYKAWFAPMFYFSATAICDETSGTATAEVTEEIQGEIGATNKSTTAKFTATPNDNCTFEGWYSSDTYDASTFVSEKLEYSVTLSNSTVGSTKSKTLYALFKKNQDLQWADANMDLNLVLGATGLSSVATINNTDKTVTYTSSDIAVLTIDDEGNITTKGLGRSVVTASVEGDLTYNAESISREFTVGEKKQASFSPAWGDGAADIKVGTDTTIGLTNIATDDSFTISANPTGIITWSREGDVLTIHGAKAGTTELTLSQTGNMFLDGNTSTYTITVSKYPNTFAIAAETKAMKVGDEWESVVTNTGNGNTQVSYSESGIVTYSPSSNKIIAQKEGSTTVTFTQEATTTHEGITKTLDVTVTKVVNTLSVSLTSQEVDVDGTLTPTFTSKNSNATIIAEITDVRLSSTVTSGTDVITYSGGIISAKNGGKAKIKFKQEANDMYTGFESEEFEITVNKINNPITFTLAGGSVSNIKLKYGATALLNYESVNKDTDIEVRRRSGSYTTYTNGTIKAGNTAGTDIYEIRQAETYKYEAGYASFTIRVNNTDEAVGYVLNDATEYSHGTGSGVVHTYDLSGPGETLTYQASRGTAITIYYNLYVEYSADNQNWEEAQDNQSLDANYKEFSCSIPETARYVRFRFPAGGTLTKYIKDVKVTRKTYVRASADKTDLGEVYTDCNPKPKATFTVNYSSTNGGNIGVSSSNKNFTPSVDELAVENNSDGTKTFTVTYTPDPDKLGAESAIITIGDLFYSQQITLTASSKKYATTITRGSNTETTTTVDGTIANAFAFTGTSSSIPSNNSSDDFYYTISHTQTSDVNKGEGVISYNSSTNTIKGLNAGTARLTIYQKKTNIYEATSQSFDFTVSKLPNNVSFALSTNTLKVDDVATVQLTNDDSKGALSATFSNIAYTNEAQNRQGGLLTFTPETKRLFANNAGTVTVTVTQAETYKYESKSAQFDVTVNKFTQTLTWDDPDLETAMQMGNTLEGNTAKSSAGLTPVTYSSNNTNAIVVDSETGVLTAKATGSNITITASQAGNYKYLPASITRQFSVFNKKTPVFDADEHFTGSNGKIEIEGTATITVTSVSDGVDGDFTITTGDDSIISVERDGETITITGLALGSTTLTLEQVGNDDYTAKSQTYNIEVYMPDDYLTLSPTEAPSFAARTYRRVVLNRVLKAGYNSLALPFNTTVEDIMGADYDATTDWVAQLNLVTYNKQDGYSLYFERSNEIVANQPYILHLSANKSNVVFKNVDLVAATSATQTATGGVSNYSEWQMVSNYSPNCDMAGKYGVVNGEGVLKKGSTGSTLKAFHAYIEGPTSAQVKAAYLDEDEADGILELINNQENQSGDQLIYDLQGRRLPRAQAGINIVIRDGKVRKEIEPRR